MKGRLWRPFPISASPGWRDTYGQRHRTPPAGNGNAPRNQTTQTGILAGQPTGIGPESGQNQVIMAKQKRPTAFARQPHDRVEMAGHIRPRLRIGLMPQDDRG